MVPSRGLRPAHIVSFNSRQSLCLRNPSSRQFSSLPRAPTLSGARHRTHSLRSATWRTGASTPYNTTGTTTAIRHGSWYAPWTWGGSSKPGLDASPTATPSELTPDTPEHLVSEKVVTTATPELSPAGIDKAAVVDGASTPDSTIDSLLEEMIQNPNGPVPTYLGDPTTAIDRFGALKGMGLDFGWGPTATFEWLIEHVYILSPWGWGASIIASTVILRTALFYFQMKGSDNMGKMAALQPLANDSNLKMREAVRTGDHEKAEFHKNRLARLYKEAGINPITGMLPMLWQMIFGFGAWRCIRNMSWLPVPGMDQGGWLWFQNLAVPDPYFLVPALGAGIVYLTVRLGGETGTANQTTGGGAQKLMLYVFPPIMFFIMSGQPVGVALYILVSSSIGAVTAAILRNSNFRSTMNLSQLPTKEAQEVWSKVARGEVKVNDVIDGSGKIIYKPAYQAPARPATPKTITVKAKSDTPSRTTYTYTKASSGLKVKSNSALPPHLEAPAAAGATYVDPAVQDRDHDYNEGPQGGLNAKADWVLRNYKPKFVYRRMKNWIWDNPEVQMRMTQREKEVAERKKRELDARRKGR